MTEPLDVQAFAKGMHELLIMSAVRDGARHGYQIALDLERRSGGLFSLQHGTLYPILHRLEREGWIEGRWEEGEGRRRKLYDLTRRGRDRLDADTARCHEVFQGLLSVVEERGEAARDESA